MSTNAGGPAFPRPGFYAETESASMSTSGQAGMTLRDYFAGQALVGACARGWSPTYTLAGVARDCYALADAMLAEREKA